VGTVKNQTKDGLPVAATVNGEQNEGGALSFLPGQKLSRCTCPGESHPGPKHSDGTFVGRSAPEIDVFEAQVRRRFETDSMHPIDKMMLQVGSVAPQGEVSQSAQWAVSFDHISLASDAHFLFSLSMQGTSGSTPRPTK
jgi:hypothetical protein